jgi:hypothetical protein
VSLPRTPAPGFQGTQAGSPETPLEPICPPSCTGGTPERPEEPTSQSGDIYAYLQNIFQTLSNFRDNYLLMTSGIVCSVDPERPSADGLIVFPTDWPITTLSSDIPDSSVDEGEDLTDLESIQVNDVSGLPDEGGFVSIINDSVPIMYVSGNKNQRAVGYTSLATSASPIYLQNNFTIQDSATLRPRIFGLGTNVEIMGYSTVDRDSNLLLNVKRKQLGTTSTRHAPGDLVFGGRLSIHFGPVSYRFKQTENRKRIDAIDCVLRSNGKIELSLRKRDLGNPEMDDIRTTLAYVHYHATLLREIEPIPLLGQQ